VTPAGLAGCDRLFAARQEHVERFLLGWKPEEYPDLLRLLSRFTHELAAGDERPGRDLEYTDARVWQVQLALADEVLHPVPAAA
jgi:hypothetical protein